MLLSLHGIYCQAKGYGMQTFRMRKLLSFDQVGHFHVRRYGLGKLDVHKQHVLHIYSSYTGVNRNTRKYGKVRFNYNLKRCTNELFQVFLSYT